MAEAKLNATVRPNQGVRRTTTHSGVTHIREFQPDRYTIVGNHLAQHRELSLTAIGLAVHVLSLPEGAQVDIRTLAARFPEGRDRIAFALRELEAGGYVDRVRERVADGRVVTHTYAYNAPALTRARGRVSGELRDAPAASTAPTTQVTPVTPVTPITTAVTPGTPLTPVTPLTPAVDDECPEEPVPPTPEDAAEPEPPRSEHHDKAESLLVGLRRADARFTLSARDVRRLIPAVVAWFDNGADRDAVHYALTADLPALVRHPAGLLAHRLEELLPPPLPSSPEPSADADTEPSLPYPIQDCEGECNRVFRAPEPGRCRDCRNRAAAASDPGPGPDSVCAPSATPGPPGPPNDLEDTS